MLLSARTIWLLCFAAAFSLFVPLGASAQPSADKQEVGTSWYVQAGSYFHYDVKEDYEGPRWFAGVEHHKRDNWVVGFSVFNNSYGQFSQYAYLGKSFHPWDLHPGFRIKLTGGIVHGYEGDHHKIMPIRWGDAWGLGVVPGVGYQFDSLGIDVAVLSQSGLLFLVGYEF